MRLGFKHSTSPLRSLISTWKEDYIIYHHRLLYVLGLVFSRLLTNYAFTTILVLYFTNNGSNLGSAVILSSFQTLLASILVLILGHISSSCVGKFPTLLFSTIVYIVGLFLFWMYQPYDNLWLVGAALVLLALGEGGVYILEDIVIDLLHDIDRSAERSINRSTSRAVIWLVMAIVFAAITAVLWVVPGALLSDLLTWRTTPLVCLIIMAITLVIFCTGYNVYSKYKYTQRATGMFFRVFRVRIKKLIKYSCTRAQDQEIGMRVNERSAQDGSPQNTEMEMTINEQSAQDGSPHNTETEMTINEHSAQDGTQQNTETEMTVNEGSMQDGSQQNTETEMTVNEGSMQDGSRKNTEAEVAVNEGGAQDRPSLHLDTNGNEDNGSSSYEKDLEVVKSLLRMCPMLLTILVVSIISESGETFFYQQYSNLNTSKEIVVQLYSFVQDLSSYFIPYLYRLVCGRYWIHKKERVKIGVGMVFGLISCVSAWQLEVHRLKAVKRMHYDGRENTSISFLWLVPQFFMLGCMEGLTGEGFLKFYKSQITNEHIKNCGKEYIEIFRGFGRLLYLILIFFFKSQLGWFCYTINDSRADYYYEFLMSLAAVNFIVYCCIARFFYKDSEQHQDSTTDTSTRMLHHTGCIQSVREFFNYFLD